MKIRRIGKILFAAGLRLGGALLQVSSAVVVARIAPQEQAGHYFVGFAVATLLAVACRAGFDQAATRFVAADLAQGRVSHAQAVTRTLLGRTLKRCALVCPVLVAFCVGAVLTPALADFSARAQALVPFLVATPFLAVATLGGAALQAARRSVLSVGSMFVLPNVAVIAAALLMSQDWIGRGALNWTFAGGCILGAGLARSGLRRTWRHLARAAVAVPDEPGRDRAVELDALVRENAVIVLGNLALTWGPLALVGALSSPIEAARFGIAGRTAQLVSFALPALNFVLGPRFAALCALRQARALERALAMSLLVSAGLSSAIALPMVLGADPIMRFYGAGYAGAGSLLTLLVIAQWANGAAGAGIQFLIMTGGERVLRRIYVATTVLTIPAGAFAVARIGATGAGMLALAAAVLLNGACVLACMRRLRETVAMSSGRAPARPSNIDAAPRNTSA